MSSDTDLKPEAEDGALVPNVFLKSRNATVGIEWDNGFDTAPAHKYIQINSIITQLIFSVVIKPCNS